MGLNEVADFPHFFNFNKLNIMENIDKLQNALDIIKQKLPFTEFKNKYFIEFHYDLQCSDYFGYVDENKNRIYEIEKSIFFNSLEEAHFFYNDNLKCLCDCDDTIHYCKKDRNKFCHFNNVNFNKILNLSETSCSHFFVYEIIDKEKDLSKLIGLLIAFFQYYIDSVKNGNIDDENSKKWFFSSFSVSSFYFDKQITDSLLEIYNNSECKIELLFVWNYFENDLYDMVDFLENIYS